LFFVEFEPSSCPNKYGNYSESFLSYSFGYEQRRTRRRPVGVLANAALIRIQLRALAKAPKALHNSSPLTLAISSNTEMRKSGKDETTTSRETVKDMA